MVISSLIALPAPSTAGPHFKISRFNPPSDPRRAQDADDYLGGQPKPPPGDHAKRVARRPHQPDEAVQAAQLRLTRELDSQAYVLASNARQAERPLTTQGQAAVAQRATTAGAHADVARTTARLLLLTRESVAAEADTSRLAHSDAPDTQRLLPSKRKHQDGCNGDVRPQDRR